MTELDLAPQEVDGLPVTSEAIAAVAFSVLAWFGFIVVGDILAYVYANRVLNDPGATTVADEMATAAKTIAFVHLMVMAAIVGGFVLIVGGVWILGTIIG